MDKKVYTAAEVEELTAAINGRNFECPRCGGTGAEYWFDPYTGDEGYDTCPDCDGTGELWILDCRPCKYCDAKIYFEKNSQGKWIPHDAVTDEQHYC